MFLPLMAAASLLVVCRVNQLLAQVLGVPEDFFVPFFQCALDRLRGIHYHSPQGSDPDRGVMGAGAHTDW